MSSPSTPDLSSFPTRRRVNSFEEFAVGQVFEHHWGKTVTAGDNSLFASVTHAYNPLYLNAEVARARRATPTSSSARCSCCASSSALSVEDLSEAGGPFLGVDELTFHRAGATRATR